MIVGETSIVSREIERLAAWQVASAGLSVTKPDGTAEMAAVSISPTTACVTQTLSASLTPSQAGGYGLRWSYTDNLGTGYVLLAGRFATYTDAKGIALTRLQREGFEIPDLLFERELASIARLILQRWPQIGNGLGTSATIGNYGALVLVDDQANFDEAAALLVCARLVGPLASGGAASDASGVKAGDQQSSFVGGVIGDEAGTPGDSGAGSGGYGGVSERRRWLREAAERIGAISWVSQAVSSQSAFSPFRVSGPSRAARARGKVQTLLSDVIELLTDEIGVLDEAYPWNW